MRTFPLGSADRKRCQRKGATSKNVKNHQKVSKRSSTLFDLLRAGQKTSKIVKKGQIYFWHFLTIFARHQSDWRCEFLREFRCKFLRSTVAFLGRFIESNDHEKSITEFTAKSTAKFMDVWGNIQRFPCRVGRVKYPGILRVARVAFSLRECFCNVSQFCTRNFKHNFTIVFTTRICRHGHAE